MQTTAPIWLQIKARIARCGLKDVDVDARARTISGSRQTHLAHVVEPLRDARDEQVGRLSRVELAQLSQQLRHAGVVRARRDQPQGLPSVRRGRTRMDHNNARYKKRHGRRIGWSDAQGKREAAGRVGSKGARPTESLDKRRRSRHRGENTRKPGVTKNKGVGGWVDRLVARIMT